MALIFIGSSLSGLSADGVARQVSRAEEPWRLQRIKDVAHVTEYAILTLLLIRAFTERSWRPSSRQMVWCFSIATLYGVGDEIHQYFVPYRFPGLDDVIRDTAGAALATISVFLMTVFRKPRRAAP
jgi:VanZ family protein